MTEALKTFNNLNVGDILTGRYDWDDYHRVDFYRIVDKKAVGDKLKVKLQKLGKTTVSGNAMLGKVRPVMNASEGKPFIKTVTDKGYCYEKDRYSNTIYLNSKYNPTDDYGEMRLN